MTIYPGVLLRGETGATNGLEGRLQATGCLALQLISSADVICFLHIHNVCPYMVVCVVHVFYC